MAALAKPKSGTLLVALMLGLALCAATQAAPILVAQIGDGLAGGLLQPSPGVYEIMGSGTDVWGNADDCYFVYQEFSATQPFDMWARVGLTGFVGGTDGWRKAGIMIRQSLTDTSRGAEMLIAETDANGVNTQIRKTDGAAKEGSANTGTRITYDTPAYLRLQYLGDGLSFNTYYKKNLGDPWLRQDTPAFNIFGAPLTGTMVAGLFVTAHNVGQQTTVQFGDVSGFVLLEPSAGTLQWDPAAGSANWGTSNWLAVPPGPPPPPPVFPDGTITALLDSANTVTVDANRAAHTLNISNSGVVAIGAGNTLLVRGPINASPGGTISLSNNGTLSTGPDSAGGTVETLSTIALGGSATVDLARGQVTARRLTMATGDRLIKAGFGNLIVDQSAGANSLDGTNTLRVNKGDLKMRCVSLSSPLNGADLILDGGTFTVQGATAFGNVLQAGRFQDGNFAQDFSASGGAYTDDGVGIFSGQQLLATTPAMTKTQTGALSYGSTAAFNTYWGTTGDPNEWQGVWTGYYVAQQAGVHQFRVQSASGGDIDDDGAVWVDGDQSGTFAASEGGTTGGQFTETTVALAVGQRYAVAFGFNENTGGESYRVQFIAPSGPYAAWTTVDPTAQAGYWQSQIVGAIGMTDTDVTVLSNSGLTAITDATASFGSLVIYDAATLATSGGTTTFTGISFTGPAGRTVGLANANAVTAPFNDGGVATNFVKSGAGTLTLSSVTAGDPTVFRVNAGTLATQGPAPLGSADNLLLGGGTFGVTGPAGNVNMSGVDVAVIAATTGSTINPATGVQVTFDDLAIGAGANVTLSGGASVFDSTDFGAGSTLLVASGNTSNLGRVTTNGNANVDGAGRANTVTYNDQGVPSTMRIIGSATFSLDNTVPGSVVANNTLFRTEGTATLTARGAAPLGAGDTRVQLAGGTVDLNPVPANSNLGMADTDFSVVANSTLRANTSGSAMFGRLSLGPTGILTTTGPTGGMRFTDTTLGGTPAPTVAYVVPAGTVGNQAYTGSLGMEFNVASNVWLTQFGVFDSGSNGLGVPMNVRLYDRNNTAFPIASLSFTPGDPGTLVDGSRLKTLATPIMLPAGFLGTIVADGFNVGDENGNLATGFPWTTNSGGGALSFVGSSRYGTVGVYPGTGDGGPANRYAAGTFQFEGAANVGFNTAVPTYPGPLIGSGNVPALVLKQGASDLILDQPGSGLQRTTLQAEAGRLIVKGAAPVTGATLNIRGGNLMLVSGATDVVFPNPIRATSGGTLIGASEGTGLATGSVILPDLKPTQGAVITMRDQIASCALILPNGVNAPTVVTPNALSHYGYHINNDAVVMNLNNNAGMLAFGKPASFQTFYGTSLLTSGPGGRGLDFDNDGDFLATGNIGQSDNYSNLFIGKITVTPATAGKWSFGIAAQDDPTGIWIDLNRNGIFESTTAADLANDRGEELLWNASGAFRSLTLAAGEYMVAFTHREGGSGSQIDARFWVEPTMGLTPTAVANMVKVQPANPAQAGLWSAITPGGGLDIVEGETRTLGDLSLATLTLSPGGMLNRSGRNDARDLTITDNLTMNKDLAMTLGRVLTTTGATVNVNPGTTLYVDQNVNAANLNLQGNLVRTGAGANANVAVTQTLTLASTLDFTGPSALASTGASLGVASTGKLVMDEPIAAKALSTAGTVSAPGGTLTDLIITGGTTTLTGNTTVSGSLKGGGGTLATQGNIALNVGSASLVALNNTQLRVSGGNLTVNVPAVAGNLPSGLAGHYDATVLAGTPNLGSVTRWNDLSGNARNLDNYVGNPTFVASGPNSQPVVNFYTPDGNDTLWTSFNFDALTEYTVFSVERLTGGDNERFTTSRTRNWLFGHHGGGDARWHAEGWITAQGGNANTTWDINAGTINSLPDPQGNFWFNGTQTTTNSTGSGNTNYMIGQLQLGSYGTGYSENSNAQMAEILIYNRVLTATELNSVGSYLESKYGLAAYNYPATALARPALLGDLVLESGRSVTVTGGPAEFSSITTTASPKVSGGLAMSNFGSPAISASPSGQTLTLDATIAAASFNVTGPGTVALTKDLTIASGGALSVPSNVALNTTSTLTLDAANASVVYKGGLNVTGGTLTLNTPAPLAAPINAMAYWGLNETSGTTASDSSGNSRFGTLVNNPVWVPGGGMIGGALQFNDANTYVAVTRATNGGINIDAASFSLSAWTKLSPTAVASDYFFGQGSGGTNDTVLHVGRRNATQETIAFYGDDLDYTNAAVVSDTVNWHHWVMTFDASAATKTQSIWADGKLVASRGTTNNATFTAGTSTDFWIGQANNGNWFGGLVDEAAVYGRVLTAAEIQNMYNAGLNGGYGPVGFGNLTMAPGTNLILGGSGQAAFDSIRAAGGATITGSVTNRGIVAPGTSPGTLNITGNFAMGAGSTYQWEAQLTDPGPPPVVSRDLIAVSGNLDISQNWKLALNPLNVVPSGSYDVMTYGSRTDALGTATPVRGTTAYADLINLPGTSITTGGTGAGAVSVNLAMKDLSEWTSSGDTAWTTPGNWTPNQVPNATRAAVVNTNNAIATVTAPMGLQQAETLIIDNGGHVHVDGGNLQVMGNAWVEPTGTLTVNSTLKVGSTVLVPGPSGLVGYWALNEGSGGTAVDTSGAGKNGTITGATWISDPVRGTALQFNGTSDYVTMGALGVSGNAPRSIAGWARSNDAAGADGDWTGIFGWSPTGADGNGRYFDVEVRGAGAPKPYCLHLYGREDNFGPLTNDPNWHFFAATYDGTNVSLYTDGNATPVVTYQPAWPLDLRDEFGMGRRPQTGEYFNGVVDDVAVWNRALSAADIQTLYQTGPNSVPLPLVPTFVGGTLTTAGTTIFGPDANLEIPRINVVGGTTTGLGTPGTPHATLAAGTTLKLAGGTLAGTFEAKNTSTIPGYYAFEIESGTSNANLIGPTASLRKTTAGSAELNGPMTLNTMSVEAGSMTLGHTAPLVANALDVKSGASLTSYREAQLGKLNVDGTMTMTRNVAVSQALTGSGSLVADGTMVLDASSAQLVSLAGELRVVDTSPSMSGHLIVNVPAAAMVGALSQNFDALGTSYVPRTENVAPCPVLMNEGAPHNNFMQIIRSGINDQRNSIAFDRTLTGPKAAISATFNMRMGSGADGGGFALLNTASYGTSGAGPNSPPWEEPNLTGSFGVGFDVYDNIYEVSLHWNGAAIVARQTYDYRNKGWQPVNVDIAFASGGANVSLDVAGNSIYSNYFIPGMTAYESRALFGGRTGGASTSFEVDDIDIKMGTPLAKLGNLKLDPGTQLTLGGAGVANFTSMGAVGGPTASGGLTLGGPTLGGAANVKAGTQTLTVNGTLDAQSFNLTGPGTVTLTDRLTVNPGGKLNVAKGVTLASQGNVTMDISSATVDNKGLLNVAGTLTLTLPDASTRPAGSLISGAALRFDPTDIDGNGTLDNLATGTAIGTWVNKGTLTGVNATQGTAARQPTVTNAAMNGNAVLSFSRGAPSGATGIEDYLEINNAALTTVLNNPHTIFVVARTNNGGADDGAANNNYQAIVCSPGNHNDIRFNGGFTSGSTGITAEQWYGANAGAIASSGAYTQGTVAVLDEVITGNSTAGPSSVQLFINGAAQPLATNTDRINNSNPSILRVGAGSTSGNWSWFLTGDVAQILVYPSALSATDRQSVENFLMNKWLGNYTALGDLNLAAGAQLILNSKSGGPGTAGFTSIVSGNAAQISGNVAVGSRLNVAETLTIGSTLTLSDGMVYEWDIVKGPRDLVQVLGDLQIDKSFTLRLFGAGGSISPDELIPIFLYSGNLSIGGLPWNSVTNPLQYVIDIGNLEDPNNLYIWDICDANLQILNIPDQGIYLTGLTAELIPEPTTLTLLGLGALALLRRRRRAA